MKVTGNRLDSLIIGAASCEIIVMGGLLLAIMCAIITGSPALIPVIIQSFCKFSPDIFLLVAGGAAASHLIAIITSPTSTGARTPVNARLCRSLILYGLIPAPLYIRMVMITRHIWCRVVAGGYSDPLGLALSLVTVFGLLTVALAGGLVSIWLFLAKHIARLCSVRIEPELPDDNHAEPREDYWQDMVALNRYIIRTQAEAQKERKRRQQSGDG